MNALVKQLSHYATYHRDRRNILTHFIGIPMIVLAISILLARPVLMIEHPWSTPAFAVALLSMLYYLRLDLRYGLVLGAFMSLCLTLAAQTAVLSTGAWLATGLGLFVVGWIFQFIGHFYEGRKPAFFDDIIGLLIGPLFVVAELGFLLGLRRDVEDEITALAGPVRDHARPATPGGQGAIKSIKP